MAAVTVKQFKQITVFLKPKYQDYQRYAVIKPNLYVYDTEQGLAVRFFLLLFFVNKVLLEHSLIHLHIIYGFFCTAGRVE